MYFYILQLGQHKNDSVKTTQAFSGRILQYTLNTIQRMWQCGFACIVLILMQVLVASSKSTVTTKSFILQALFPTLTTAVKNVGMINAVNNENCITVSNSILDLLHCPPLIIISSHCT